MTTRSGKLYSNPVTVATTTLTNPAPPINPNPHKWSHSKSFNYFDFNNIQGGMHDLPEDANSWLPLFLGKSVPGNTHWAQLYDNFEFHLAG